ncbi:MAG: hypothetical protein WAL59_18970 [Roseiarcus sp.]
MMNQGTVFRVAAMLQHELQIIELAIVEHAGDRIRPDNLRAGVQQQPGAGGIATLDRMVQGFVVIRVRASIQKQLRHADVMRPSGGARKSRQWRSWPPRIGPRGVGVGAMLQQHPCSG